jgi:hypothetical protein
VRNGSALKMTAVQGRPSLLQSRQAVLTAELQLAALTTELTTCWRFRCTPRLELAPAAPATDQRPREQYVSLAWSENPQCFEIRRIEVYCIFRNTFASWWRVAVR